MKSTDKFTTIESLLQGKFISQLFTSTVLTASLLTSAPTLANDLCADAKDCYRQGVVLYEQRNYEEALQFFQESYKRTTNHKARSTLLYNIASTYANLRQPLVAIKYLELYLAENPGAKKEVSQQRETLAMYNEGLEFYNQKNYEAAAKNFKIVYDRAAQGLRVIVARDLAESYEQLLILNDLNRKPK